MVKADFVYREREIERDWFHGCSLENDGICKKFVGSVRIVRFLELSESRVKDELLYLLQAVTNNS